jgi:zinc protease
VFLAALNPLAAQAAEPEAPKLPIDAYRLPNGLKVALSRDPSVPRVVVCVAYHVGSKNERAGRTGFAHFFEHMMFRGTKNVENYDIPLQESGAQSNAFTSEDLTVYFEVVPSNYLERALYLEAERLAFLPSALNQQKFDTEREVVKNERRSTVENQPYGTASETLLAHLFPAGHPYSWSVIGSMADLNKASTDDLKRFFAEFYHPANATLCLVGDFDPEQAKAWISRYFGPLAKGPEVKDVSAPAAPSKTEHLEQTDHVQLPRVYWAWPTVADDDPDAPPLHLLGEILGSGEASRLYRALVLDKQVARDVSVSSDTKGIDGLFTIDVTAAPGHKIDEIEPVLKAEIERARTTKPTAEEIQRAQAKFEKSIYAQLTAPLSRAIVLATGYAEHNDPDYYRRDFARYFKVTADDIERVARKYLVPDKVVLVINPSGSAEPKRETITAGPRPSDAPEPSFADRLPDAGPDWSKLPGPTEPRPFKAPAILRRKLSNGLDVWVSPWHTLPIVACRLVVPAGTGDDPAGKSGLATLTATLLDKGTKDKTATELAEALELLGTSTKFAASVDNTQMGFSVVTRNLGPALDLIGPMLAAPRFDPKDVDRERELQLVDLLQGPDSPHWIAQRALRALLYGQNHPYGNPADGFPDTVKRITIDDIRGFHSKWINPAQGTLIVVGDVEPDALVKTLESSLCVWAAHAVATRKFPGEEPRIEPGVAYLVDKPGAVQSVLDVCRRWVDRKDPRYFATLVGNRILGGDFLSRLNQNLREDHGYTYGAQAVFIYRRRGSVWVVNSDVQTPATAPALKETLAELDGLRKDRPLTAKEIATARDAEARSFPESFEDPSRIAGQLLEMAEFDLPADYLDTFLDRLKATTDEEIQQAMSAVVDPASRLVLVVGDRKAVEPKLKALGFKDVKVVTYDGKPADK